VSFLQPMFLLAGVVAFLPIIFHLIRKFRVRKIRFSSLLFLKATPKELIRKRRIQDLILLIVRCTILALLALAFARPFIPEERIALIQQKQDKSMVVVIDNSFSMQYGEVFERARKEALRIIENAGNSDEIAVVVFSDEATQMTQLNNQIQDHKNIVEQGIKVSNRKTDFYKSLRLAEEILKNAKHEFQEIILISDLQTKGWSGQFENWKINPDIHFVPIKVSENIQSNVFIDKFSLKQRRTGKTVGVQYGIQIQTVGEKDTSGKEVALWINDEKLDTQKSQGMVDLDQIYFQQRDLKEGVYQGLLKLPQDSLDIDNFYYFNLMVSPPPSILCIDGSPPSSRSNRYYLQNCFNLGDQSLYRFSSSEKNILNSKNLQEYQLVFLTNENYLTEQQLTTLKRYVNQGGNLVISFGNKTDIKRFSDNLGFLGIGNIIEKVRVRQIQTTSALISEVDYKHPIFELFARTGTGDIFKPKFSQYVKVDPDSTVQVIGKYDTGDPLLMEEKLGEGKILLFTSSFNTEWGDFPVNEIFLPLVYQIVSYAVYSKNSQNSFVVGEVVRFRGIPGEEWEINGPGDFIFKGEVGKDGWGYFNDTELPGHYRASLRENDFYFCVNLDGIESDISSFDAEEFYSAVTRPASDVEENRLHAGINDIGEAENRQKMWRYIILMIGVLFLFETFYANKRLKKN
jgi:hypothetical protein